MRPVIIFFLAAFVLFLCTAYAQRWDAEYEESMDQDTAAQADSLADSLAQEYEGSATAGKIKKLKITRRDYYYRQQIGYALGMMAFILVIFTATQNWNPD